MCWTSSDGGGDCKLIPRDDAARRPTSAGDILPGVLHIHRAARADHLADALAALLSRPPADPFAPEVVAVATRGMERWLSQRLSATLGASPSRADGVCANVLFPTPHRLLSDAVAAPRDRSDRDPWLAGAGAVAAARGRGEIAAEPWLAALALIWTPGAEPDEARRSRR